MTNRIEKGIETIASEVMAAIEATRAKIAGLADAVAHLGREPKAVPVRSRSANRLRAVGKPVAQHRSGGKMPQAKAAGRTSGKPRRSRAKPGVDRK